MAINDDFAPPNGLSDQNLVDQLCDEFEASWKRGETPDIHDFLERTRPDLRPTLLIELVRVEIEYLPSDGRTPSYEEYVKRFPQFKDQLEQIQFVSSPLLETLTALKRIGNLELVQKIGKGTFGQVWKAWDSQLKRDVAVKLPTDRSLGREYATEFHREAKAAAKLNHPGIVRVISFGTETGIAYIVYDLVDGVTLKDWLKENPVSPKQAAELCAKIADALSHAHEHQVIHRDLKPTNILIDRQGNPRITDFGLAIRMDSTSVSLESDAIVGTLAYMSPEQAEGKSRHIDARTDLYSLGVILYELLSGQPVFQGNPRELFQNVLHASPPALSTKSPGISPDLATICHRCLEKKKSDRYCTAKDVADDLRRFVNGEPVLARPLSRPVRAWRWLKKRWHLVLTGAAVAGFCTLAFVLYFMPEPLDLDDTWKVLVTTNPPGAHIRIIPRHEDTGELILERQLITLELTPLVLQLAPSEYQVEVHVPRNPRHSHQVTRTVPPAGSKSPTGPGNYRDFHVISERELNWPLITIPDENITDQMVYVEGTDAFPIGDNGRTVAIAPFYVAPREFTYGDYLKIRPGERGNVKGKPATLQPPGNTMPEKWFSAEHWAEESGGRLLTEIEFEYLAVLAATAERESLENPNKVADFNLAGGSGRDAIPTTPPIRGILSGYAEWTSSRPNQSKLWQPLPLDVPADFRVIRGGTIDMNPAELGRDPRQRTTMRYFEFYPVVGFRIARSATLPPKERK